MHHPGDCAAMPELQLTANPGVRHAEMAFEASPHEHLSRIGFAEICQLVLVESILAQGMLQRLLRRPFAIHPLLHVWFIQTPSFNRIASDLFIAESYFGQMPATRGRGLTAP